MFHDREIGDEMKLKFQKLTVRNRKLLRSTISANSERRRKIEQSDILYIVATKIISVAIR